MVTGASGTLGQAVVRALQARGDDVVALSRDPRRAEQVLGSRVAAYAWPDPKRLAPPQEALDRADAVVNLLGEPVAQRWSERAKQEIRDSRVLATRALVAAMRELGERGPTTLVSQSATGYYGARGDEPLEEQSGPGEDFLAQVVVDWEREARAAEPLARVAVTRTGVVLAPGAGALAKMLPPFRLGLGGPVAGGMQYVPWVHIDDVAGVILHILDRPELTAAFNLTAPNPVTNLELSKALGRVLHRPAVLPVPALALRLIYGEMAKVVTTGQRVMPKRLLDTGYAFAFAELEPALRDLLG